MSKSHRGKGVRDKYRKGRGVCPLCKRSGIKVVYEVNKQNVCKICKAKATHQEQEQEKIPEKDTVQTEEKITQE